MFPELGDLPADPRLTTRVLDGEVVPLRPDGSQDFHALTSRRPRDTRVAFMLRHPDIDGRDLMAEPYRVRWHALEQLHAKQTDGSRRRRCRVMLAPRSTASLRGWEGVVAKRLDSPARRAQRRLALSQAPVPARPPGRPLHLGPAGHARCTADLLRLIALAGSPPGQHRGQHRTRICDPCGAPDPCRNAGLRMPTGLGLRPVGIEPTTFRSGGGRSIP